MTSADLLTFAGECFASAVSGTPPKPSGDGRASGPWYRDVPGKRFAPLIREFARTGGRLSIATGETQVLTAAIAPPVVAGDNALQVPVAYSVLGQQQTQVVTVPYPSPFVGALCRGAWVQVGPGQVKLPQPILPRMSAEPDGLTIIEWESPVEARVQVWQEGGFLRRLIGSLILRTTHVQIQRLVLHGDAYIDVQAVGFLHNNLLPRLRLV